MDLSKCTTSVQYTHKVVEYMSKVRNTCGDIPIILIGCKNDLIHQSESTRLYNATKHLNFERYESISNKSLYGMQYVLNNIANSISNE